MKQYWDELIELNGLLMTLGLGGIAGVGGLLWKQVIKFRDESVKSREETEVRFKKLEFANMALLHDKIYQQCTTHLNQGWVSVDDLENLEYLWRGYHGLGGNGTGEILYKKVTELPNKKEEKTNE